eukprot:g1815.t1
MHEVVVNLTTDRVEPSKDLVLETIDTDPNATVLTGYVKYPEKHATAINISIVSSVPPRHITVQAGEAVTLFLLSAIVTDVPDISLTRSDEAFASSPETVQEAALAIFENANRKSDVLRNEHIRAWDAMWSRGGVEVKNNSALAAQINASFYYMLSSVRENVFYPVGPGGLQTNGYKGNAYWDNDVWAMPSLLASWPKLSLTGLMYRKNRMDAAASHARDHGYRGLYYPFQTAGTGNECDLFEPANKLEIHVGSGIALLARKLSRALGNETVDANVIRPLVSGIADFYVSRAVNPDLTSIKNVVGPDEYGIGFPLYSGVTDSVYVNSAAKLTAAYACELSQNASTRGEWETLASSLTVLVSDPGTDMEYHPEYSGWPKANRYFGGKVKQADVTMIHWPLNAPNLSDTSLRNDLNTYEALYDDEGPAMTLSVSVVGWLRLGDRERANVHLVNSTENIQAPFHVWTESRDPHQHQTLKDEGCYNFLTGAGGFLQSIIYGYGGISFDEAVDRVTIRPKGFPLDVSDMLLRSVSFRGGRFSVRLTEEGSSIGQRITICLVGHESSGADPTRCAYDIFWGDDEADRGTPDEDHPSFREENEIAYRSYLIDLVHDINDASKHFHNTTSALSKMTGHTAMKVHALVASHYNRSNERPVLFERERNKVVQNSLVLLEEGSTKKMLRKKRTTLQNQELMRDGGFAAKLWVTLVRGFRWLVKKMQDLWQWMKRKARAAATTIAELPDKLHVGVGIKGRVWPIPGIGPELFFCWDVAIDSGTTPSEMYYCDTVDCTTDSGASWTKTQSKGLEGTCVTPCTFDTNKNDCCQVPICGGWEGSCGGKKIVRKVDTEICPGGICDFDSCCTVDAEATNDDDGASCTNADGSQEGICKSVCDLLLEEPAAKVCKDPTPMCCDISVSDLEEASEKFATDQKFDTDDASGTSADRVDIDDGMKAAGSTEGKQTRRLSKSILSTFQSALEKVRVGPSSAVPLLKSCISVSYVFPSIFLGVNYEISVRLSAFRELSNQQSLSAEILKQEKAAEVSSAESIAEWRVGDTIKVLKNAAPSGPTPTPSGPAVVAPTPTPPSSTVQLDPVQRLKISKLAREILICALRLSVKAFLEIPSNSGKESIRRKDLEDAIARTYDTKEGDCLGAKEWDNGGDAAVWKKAIKDEIALIGDNGKISKIVSEIGKFEVSLFGPKPYDASPFWPVSTFCYENVLPNFFMSETVVNDLKNVQSVSPVGCFGGNADDIPPGYYDGKIVYVHDAEPPTYDIELSGKPPSYLCEVPRVEEASSGNFVVDDPVVVTYDSAKWSLPSVLPASVTKDDGSGNIDVEYGFFDSDGFISHSLGKETGVKKNRIVPEMFSVGNMVTPTGKTGSFKIDEIVVDTEYETDPENNLPYKLKLLPADGGELIEWAGDTLMAKVEEEAVAVAPHPKGSKVYVDICNNDIVKPGSGMKCYLYRFHDDVQAACSRVVLSIRGGQKCNSNEAYYQEGEVFAVLATADTFTYAISFEGKKKNALFYMDLEPEYVSKFHLEQQIRYKGGKPLHCVEGCARANVGKVVSVNELTGHYKVQVGSSFWTTYRDFDLVTREEIISNTKELFDVVHTDLESSESESTRRKIFVPSVAALGKPPSYLPGLIRLVHYTADGGDVRYDVEYGIFKKSRRVLKSDLHFFGKWSDSSGNAFGRETNIVKSRIKYGSLALGNGDYQRELIHHEDPQKVGKEPICEIRSVDLQEGTVTVQYLDIESTIVNDVPIGEITTHRPLSRCMDDFRGFFNVVKCYKRRLARWFFVLILRNSLDTVRLLESGGDSFRDCMNDVELIFGIAPVPLVPFGFSAPSRCFVAGATGAAKALASYLQQQARDGFAKIRALILGDKAVDPQISFTPDDEMEEDMHMSRRIESDVSRAVYQDESTKCTSCRPRMTLRLSAGVLLWSGLKGLKDAFDSAKLRRYSAASASATFAIKSIVAGLLSAASSFWIAVGYTSGPITSCMSCVVDRFFSSMKAVTKKFEAKCATSCTNADGGLDQDRQGQGSNVGTLAAVAEQVMRERAEESSETTF